MNEAGPDSTQRQGPEPFLLTWRVVRGAFVLTSAGLLALLISGGVFVFTPLVGVRIAHTSGVSMEPALKSGDVVLIRDVGDGDFGVGDVVVFDVPGRQVIHRVIEQRSGPNGEALVVTQGDNVPRPDIPIDASQVNGKLVTEVPLLGALSRWLDAQGGVYVYRSIVLTLAVAAVASWGLTASAGSRRKAPATRGALRKTTRTGPDE